MIKEPLIENPTIIGAAIAGAVFLIRLFIKEKNKELIGKVDEKDLKLREKHLRELEEERAKDREEKRILHENNMKGWVVRTINESIEKLSAKLDKDRQAMENNWEKALERMEKRWRHDKANEVAGLSGTINICKEALEAAKSVLELAKKH